MPHPARFLLPDLPYDDKYTQALFVDRKQELEQALTQIRSVCEDSLGRPLVIAGPARCGKSHLLRMVALEIEKDFDCVVRVQISLGLTDSRDILREAANQVYAALYTAALERGIGPPEGPHVLGPLENIRTTYSEAIAGFAAELEVSRMKGVSTTFKTRKSLSLKTPQLFSYLSPTEVQTSIGTEDSRTDTDTGSRRIKVNRFEEDALTDLIVMAHVLMREASPDWTTLLVLDDFDLLHRSELGDFNPDPLRQALAHLARIEGFFVLTTVRQDTYFSRSRYGDLHLAALVSPFASHETLVEIYQRHVDIFHDGKDPLGPRYFEEAARWAAGRVGIFLHMLRNVYELWPSEKRKVHDLKDFLSEFWSGFKRDEPAAADMIETIASRMGGDIEQEILRGLRKNSGRWLLEDYTSQASAKLDPILLSYLREKFS